MKKALIVLLILGLAGGLFAQSWSGSVQTGVKFEFGDEITVAANDDDGHAVRSRLSFTNSGDDWGVNVGVNANTLAGNSNPNNVFGDMNGWVKFGDIFKLTAGKGQGGNWQATGAVFDQGPGGSNASFRLNITPISGLDFGFVFGFPNGDVKANKIANFFLETGIGAKYDAGIFVAGTALKLHSEETTGYPETDADWWFDAKIPVSVVTIHLDGFIKNLLEKKAAQDIQTGIRVEGSVAGLDYGVQSTQNFADPLAVDAGVDLTYGGITLSDKASAEVGADAGFTVLPDFSFDSWGAYAKASYAFTGNVSSFAKFAIGGDGKFEEITPTLQLFVKYSF